MHYHTMFSFSALDQCKQSSQKLQGQERSQEQSTTELVDAIIRRLNIKENKSVNISSDDV